MKQIFVSSNRRLWSLVLLSILSNAALAADCPTGIKAITNKDVQVPVEVLTHRVMPLTKCELEAEAQAWLLLLKDKVTEISNAEVAAIYKKEEIKKEKQAEDTLEDAEKAKQAKPEAAKDAEQKAKQALKEVQEAEKKSAGDAAVQKAIKAAESKAKQEAGADSATGKEQTAKTDIKTALIKTCHRPDGRAHRNH